jgi:hypothetical protein
VARPRGQRDHVAAVIDPQAGVRVAQAVEARAVRRGSRLVVQAASDVGIHARILPLVQQIGCEFAGRAACTGAPETE